MGEMAWKSLEGTEQVTQQADQRIPCFRCGVCCSRYRIRLSLVEARRIANGLGLAWNTFLDRYVEQLWPRAQDFFLRQRNGVCIFLEHGEGTKTTSCFIHSFKPAACLEWVPSLYRRECQEGLARHWGLTVGSSGELQGAAERIEHFQLFLKSLAEGRCCAY